MEQVGFVTKVDGQVAHLEVRRVSACGTSCKSCAGSCGINAEVVSVINSLNAKAGDFIEIKTENAMVLSYLLLVYGLPLLFLIVGTVFGVTFLEARGVEQYNLLGAVIGLLTMTVSFIFIKRADKNIKTKEIIKMERIL